MFNPEYADVVVEAQTKYNRLVTLPVARLEGCDWLFLDQLSINERPPCLKDLQETEGVDDLRTFKSTELDFSLFSVCTCLCLICVYCQLHRSTVRYFY